MNDIITLLKPRFWSFKNPIIKKRRKGRALRWFVLGGVGLFFWAAILGLVLRVLFYFKGVPDLGDLLAYKLLSMILITIFSLLVFSSILTALSKLYLSKDLYLVHALPVATHKIFLARWIESTIDSSWMVMVYTLPVFIAYGIAYHAGLVYYAYIPAGLLALALICSCISTLLVFIAAVLLPANRIRSIFIFLGLAGFMILFVAFRMLRPERLVDPDTFATVLSYLQTLQTPASPLLPSTWVYETFRAGLAGSTGSGLFNLCLVWSCAATLIFALTIVADAIYFKGFSGSQTAPPRLLRNKKGWINLNILKGPIRAYAVKEFKTFFRDQTQWSQLFLIGALIIIYVFNFKVLPLEKAPIRTIYLQNLLSFLNMGLAAFVLTAIAGRFVYPAISIEGEAFWIVRIAPIKISHFLWVKYMVYLLPLIILAEILIVATNIMLQVTPFIMVLSIITMLVMVPGVVAIGVGLGAAYPDFKSENPAQSVTSFGGLIFMMLCAAYIAGVIMLEAGPVYTIFMADVGRRALSGLELAWIGGSFTLVLVLGVLAVILPMRYGVRRLSDIRA